MSVFTVSAELLRSAAVFWSTCALPSDSGPPTCELDRELDAGVVVRRDLGPVHVVEGEHRGRVVRVHLDRQRVGPRPEQARDVEAEPGVGAGDRAEVATWWPFTHTSAVPTTPLTISVAPGRPPVGVKSVRHHQGTLNCAIVSAPILVI